MSATAQQKSLVRDSLFQFISKHAPPANLNVIDDVILVYVISILQEASKDPCFDVEGFIEMMSAYVPEFATIDAGMVCGWVLDLEAELRACSDETKSVSSNDDSVDDKISLTLQSLSEMLPTANTNKHNRKNYISQHSIKTISDLPSDLTQTLKVLKALKERAALYWSESDEHAELCRLLHEMFPNSCVMEIKHCVSIAHGDVERAAATLLHRREQGQALSPAALHNAIRTPLIDDNELKTRIIERYSYVDKNAETKEHKPLAPKIEPKKMVRYRDNKIVSLKGERYTEVPKSGVDEEHLKKPKKQHCP